MDITMTAKQSPISMLLINAVAFLCVHQFMSEAVILAGSNKLISEKIKFHSAASVKYGNIQHRHRRELTPNSTDDFPFDKRETIDWNFVSVSSPSNNVKNSPIFDDPYDTSVKIYKRQLPCSSGTLYPSLEACMQGCYKRKMGNETPEIEPHLFLLKYKIVLVNSADFEILKDEELLFTVKNEVFPKGSYFIDDENKASLCYAFSHYFAHCRFKIPTPIEQVRQEKYMIQFINFSNTWYDTSEFYVWNFTTDGMNSVTCDQDGKFVAHLIGASLSAVALIVTFVLIHVINDLKRSTSALLKCNIVMLMLYFIIQTIRLPIVDIEKSYCVTSGILQQFCFLSAFFWMNVQAFDLYMTLESATKNQSSRTFLYYSLFAWGLPVVIAGVTLAAELFEFSNAYYPNFALFCWFTIGSKSAILYLYGWSALSLIYNIIQFSLIVLKFRQLASNIAMANGNIRQQMIVVSIKLVVVLGFFWIFKIVYWAYGKAYGSLFYLDCATNYQGIVIFLVYICKPDLVKKFYHCLLSLCCRRKTNDRKLSEISCNTSSLTVSTVAIILDNKTD